MYIHIKKEKKKDINNIYIYTYIYIYIYEKLDMFIFTNKYMLNVQITLYLLSVYKIVNMNLIIKF